MKNKVLIFAAVLIAAVMSICGMAAPAFAGASKVYLASEASIGETINAGDFMTDGGVKAVNERAVFDETCSENAKLLAKAKVNNLAEFGVPTLFTFDCVLNFRQFAQDGRVSLSFGMNNLRGETGAEDSVALLLTYDGGIKIGVSEYPAENVPSVLYAPVKFGALALGKDFSVHIAVTTDGKLNVTVDENMVLSGRKLSVEASGYIGIFSEGKNCFEVGNPEIVAYRYDAPENIEYTETFDQGYNANVFTSQSKASPMMPSYLAAEDGKLVFSNTSGAYFSTKYTYSNFDLTFDISDLYAEAKIDEDGNIQQLISNWFGIAFGMDSYDLSADATVKQATWLQFEGIPLNVDHTKPYSGARYVLWENNKARKVSPMNTGDPDTSFSLWNKDFIAGRTVGIRLTMTDGLVSLYYRFEGEEDWGDPYFSYDLGTVKTGYIRIFTWGDNGINANGLGYNGIANFKIDNFTIRNTDYESVRNVVEAPEFKSNLRGETPDFDYEDTTEAGDLLEDRIENGTLVTIGDGTNAGLWIGIGVSAAVVVAGAAVGCIVLIRRKKKCGKN